MSELSPDEPFIAAAAASRGRRKTAAHEARAADAQTRVDTPQQRDADVAAAQEFHQIKKFVAACRRQWPGAMIVLRPDGAPTGANAPPNPGRNLTDEDARQINENVTGFFAMLAEWSRLELPTSANDAREPVASDKKDACDDR